MNDIERFYDDTSLKLAPAFQSGEIGIILTQFILLHTLERLKPNYKYKLHDFAAGNAPQDLFMDYALAYLKPFNPRERDRIRRLLHSGLLSTIIAQIESLNTIPKDSKDVNKLIEALLHIQIKRVSSKSIVRIDDSEDRHRYYIADGKQKLELPLNLLCVWNFSDGYARFITREGQWGYISKDSSDIAFYLPFSIHYAEDFNEGRARVERENELSGYIDYCGNTIIPLNYRDATDFAEGKAMVTDSMCFEPFGIDIFGNIQPKYREQYNKASAEMHDILAGITDSINDENKKKCEEQEIRKAINDDENDIMRALAHGNGETFGF